MPEQKLTWEQWEERLIEFYNKFWDLHPPHALRISNMDLYANWKGYFEDGYSPEDAVKEDATYSEREEG